MRGASPRPQTGPLSQNAASQNIASQSAVSRSTGQSRHVVTAVIVAHDAARLLPGLVNAVREQTHPVQRVIGVDTGSQDRSGATLTELLGQDAVFGMEQDTGYGAAVASALQRPAARPAGGTAGGTEWIWLLHDDCEPALDALEQLLAGAGRSRSAAVLGPKLKDLSDRRVVREAGITTDRAGRRLTGVEPGEIDQGQHDGNRAVLAVSSAGMLVRRDVWNQLGGFDDNLPLFRDDIDFCWRAHAAGYEVQVVTDAVVYHRELSARQVRKTPATGGHPRMLDRRSALYVFAVNLPFWPMLGTLAGGVAGSLVRAAWCLLTKQQRKAAAQVGAVAWLLRHPLLLRRERRRRAADRKHGYAVLRSQLPRARTLGRLAESAMGMLSRGSGYNSGGLHHAMVDEPGDDMPLPATDSAARRLFTSPGVLLFVGLAVVALVAERSLTGSVLSGSATFGGGVLVPPYSGAGSLWHEYLAGYHDTGIGSAASTPAYVGVLAALSTLFGGKPWLVIDVLLLGCVPLAGMTAFLATRRLTSVLAARIWIAASYALLPVATGAVAAGRIGTVVAFVLLPLIGVLVGRVLTGNPRTASRAAWAAGLLTAVTAAFVPLAWLVVVIAAVAATAAWSWLGPRTVLNAWIVAVVPGVLLIPWTFHLVTSPSAFFAEAGLVRPGLAAAALRPGSLLLLSPGGPGLPPAWVTAGLVLPAFAALLVRRRTVLVYAGWGIALGGLILALAVSRATVTPPQGGVAVSAWPGLAIAIAAAGLLLAATPLIEVIGRALAGQAGTGQAGRGRPCGYGPARPPGLALRRLGRRPGRGGLGARPGGRILAGQRARRPGDRGRCADPARLRGGLGGRSRPGQDPGPPSGRRDALLYRPARRRPGAGRTRTRRDRGLEKRDGERRGVAARRGQRRRRRHRAGAEPVRHRLRPAGRPGRPAAGRPAERGGRDAAADQVVLVRPVAGLGDGGAGPRGHPVRCRGRRAFRPGRGQREARPGHLGHPGAGGGRGRVVRVPRRQAADPAGGAGRRLGAGLHPARGRRPPGDHAQRDGQEPQPRRRGRRPVRGPRARPARLQVLGPRARRPRRRCPGARRPPRRRRPAARRRHPVGPPQAAAAVRAGRRDRGPWCSRPGQRRHRDRLPGGRGGGNGRPVRYSW